MKKEYIMHRGEISNCPANVSKMGLFEYIKLIDKFSPFKEWWSGFLEAGNHLLCGIAFIILHVIAMILMPLVYWRHAHLAIKRAKEFVKAHAPK